jgi:hypothetical protein
MEHVIAQTQRWIEKVVVGCNFCPFAARELRQGSVHYQVDDATTVRVAGQRLLTECQRLDQDESISTSFLIFPLGFEQFPAYLELVSTAERLMRRNGYDGVYQIASFHPLYQFAGTDAEDPANFTNRSIYPMLHLLREDHITKALRHYANPGRIPENNIDFARNKGRDYMKMLRDSCF